jgi:uncharacterized protein YndB with AHSA1/START domain
MARIEGEIAINRPVDEVFDFVADERNEPRYNPRIARVEKLSSGPIGHGTQFRAEAASWPRTVPMTIQYTTYERPRRLASSIRMAAADIQGTLTWTRRRASLTQRRCSIVSSASATTSSGAAPAARRLTWWPRRTC